MTQIKKWSEEAKLKNRRKRMARRLYKNTPLFAIGEIKARFGIDYTADDFFEDQRLKGNKPSKKRRGKRRRNGKTEYLEHIQRKVKDALATTDETSLQKIMARYYLIAKDKSKPWRIRAKFSTGEKIEYFFPLNYSAQEVKKFSHEVNQRIKNGASPIEIDKLYEEKTKYAHFGR